MAMAIVLVTALRNKEAEHKIVLVPTYISYRNSDIMNSDSDFSTGTTFFFSDIFPPEFFGITELEAEIPIPDPPARGAVSAEFPTKDAIIMLFSQHREVG